MLFSGSAGGCVRLFVFVCGPMSGEGVVAMRKCSEAGRGAQRFGLYWYMYDIDDRELGVIHASTSVSHV